MLHITTRIEGKKHDDLLTEKSDRPVFPSFLFLDAKGEVIARHNGRNRSTFTVRKLSGGVGVERVFPVHSPYVKKIDVIRKGKVRRAKLYYLRSRRGKAARVRKTRD